MENKEDNNIELSDLPDDCIAEILKYIKTRNHRNDSRFVCKVWHLLIDQDSSTERYLVNKKTTRCLDEGMMPKFSDFITQFVNFNRKKISFRFDHVDLHNTDYFWTEKGVDIIELNFENLCTGIPLERVFSECIQLREMFICSYANEIIYALESLAAKEFRNYSLNFLTITENFGGLTLKIATHLVQLISKVFPHLRKVTLHNIQDTSKCNYKELLKKFIQLKYELEWNFQCSRVVFDPSSKSPISVRKVSTDNWTISPHDYYKNLEEIDYFNAFDEFRLSEFENLFSTYPVLQILNIKIYTLISDLRKPVTNQLKQLYLGNFYREELTVDTVFLDTFKCLTIFHVHNVSYASFADIVENMPHLEDLSIENVYLMGEDLVINDERDVLVHTHLKKLKIPSNFIFYACTIYRFDNLTEIADAEGEEFSEIWKMQSVAKVLQRLQCPNLKLIHFGETVIHEAVDFLWLENLRSMFPKLERYQSCVSRPDTEHDILVHSQICPKVKVCDEHLAMDIYSRTLILT